MKIIEALKKLKELERKKNDLTDKIKKHSAYLSFETPLYTDQRTQIAQVSKWVQSCEDILKEILSLRLKIQKTNLLTAIDIEINGKKITKPIAAWVHRRRDLAQEQVDIWKGLTDRNLEERQIRQSDGTIQKVTIERCYNPVERDEKVELYTNEKFLIDSKLEIVNAITDLLEE